MIEETVVFRVQSDGASKSLKQLTKDSEALNEQVSKLEEGTEEYDKAAKELTNTLTQLNKVENAATNVNRNLASNYADVARSIGGLASGFYAVSSAASLFGGENEKLLEQVARLQAIQGLAQGFTGLGRSITSATKLIPALTNTVRALGSALSSLPLVGVLAGLTAISLALVPLIPSLRNNRNNTEDLDRAFQDFNDTIEQNNKLLAENIRQLELQGASEEKIYEAKQETLQGNIEKTEQYIAQLKEQYDAELAALQAADRGTLSMARRVNELKKLIKEQEARLSEFRSQEEQEAENFEERQHRNQVNANDRARREAQRAYEQRLADQKAAQERSEKLERERIARLEGYEAQRRQDFLDTIYEFNEDVNNFFNDLEEPDIPFIDKIVDFSNPEAVEARLEELRNEAEQLKAIFTEEGLGTAAGVDAWKRYLKVVQDVGDIEDQYNKEQDKRRSERERLRDAELASYATFLNASSQLLGQNTVAGKTIAVAGATIDTYRAANKAFSTFPPPASYAALAAALATGFANVKSILSTNVPGTSDTGSTSVSTPALPTMPEIDTSAFEVYSTINPSDLDILNQVQPVLVVEDINQVQNRVQVRENLATF